MRAGASQHKKANAWAGGCAARIVLLWDEIPFVSETRRDMRSVYWVTYLEIVIIDMFWIFQLLILVMKIRERGKTEANDNTQNFAKT